MKRQGLYDPGAKPTRKTTDGRTSYRGRRVAEGGLPPKEKGNAGIEARSGGSDGKTETGPEHRARNAEEIDQGMRNESNKATDKADTGGSVRMKTSPSCDFK